MNKKMLVGITILILGGCTISRPVSEKVGSNSWTEMSEFEEFSIQAQTVFEERITRPDGSIALTTFDTSTTDRLASDYSVYMHLFSILPCNYQTMGVSQINKIEKEGAQWGKVNIWDNMEMEGWDWTQSEKVVCKKEGTPPPDSVYSLCSEKDEKTVIVCINQTADNPTLAKKIFETFRWTE